MIENQDLESRISALEEELRRLKQKEYDRLTDKLEEEQYRLWLTNVGMYVKNRGDTINESFEYFDPTR